MCLFYASGLQPWGIYVVLQIGKILYGNKGLADDRVTVSQESSQTSNRSARLATITKQDILKLYLFP